MSAARKVCFVIMPFSQTTEQHTEEYWTKHFNDFLKPLIEKCSEFEVIRSEPLRGDVLKKIITQLVVCPIVVVDLTDLNPNVFWELGVRQSFRHGTITIAEEGTEIPFDISVTGVLFYHPKDHLKNAIFCERFGKAVKDYLVNPSSPDSHVLETLSGRGTLFEIFRKNEALRRVEALISEYEWNRKTIDKVYEDTEKKLETFTARRLRTSSVELLVTNRYLDEDASFYRTVEAYFDLAVAINERLAAWVLSPESTEEWLTVTKKSIFALLDIFAKMLNGIKEKLSASCQSNP
jgi:hypothetical protein